MKKVEFAVGYSGAGCAFNLGDVAEVPDALAAELIESRQAREYVAPAPEPADAEKPAKKSKKTKAGDAGEGEGDAETK